MNFSENEFLKWTHKIFAGKHEISKTNHEHPGF